MDRPILDLLDLAQGPIFRAAVALMILGVLRRLSLGVAEITAAYVSIPEPATFWQKLRARLAWNFIPGIMIERRHSSGAGALIYAAFLSGFGVMMRVGVIVVPMFMVEHVYLWERTLGVKWPALPATIADILAILTIAATAGLFLGRLYSPRLRSTDPAWSFLKPLVVLLPFLSGYMAMHPQFSPFSYHFVMLVHVLSACLLFVMIPFGRVLSWVHAPLVACIPEADWPTAASETNDARAAAAKEVTV